MEDTPGRSTRWPRVETGRGTDAGARSSHLKTQALFSPCRSEGRLPALGGLPCPPCSSKGPCGASLLSPGGQPGVVGLCHSSACPRHPAAFPRALTLTQPLLGGLPRAPTCGGDRTSVQGRTRPTLSQVRVRRGPASTGSSGGSEGSCGGTGKKWALWTLQEGAGYPSPLTAFASGSPGPRSTPGGAVGRCPRHLGRDAGRLPSRG